MTKTLTALAFALAALAPSAYATTHKEAPDMAKGAASAPMSKQQTKMGSCNAGAKDMKGDERKAYMKQCLSSKPSKQAAQQTKMKTCNKEASAKKGDERKAFMKECLSA